MNRLFQISGVHHIMPPYLKVILDSDATILRFECQLFDCHYSDKEIIGKNWFDLFIDTQDKEAVMKVFKGLFYGDEQSWKSYKNDIICKSGQYRLLDFHNQIFEKDGVRYLNSIAIEHFVNQDALLGMLASRLAE